MCAAVGRRCTYGKGFSRGGITRHPRLLPFCIACIVMGFCVTGVPEWARDYSLEVHGCYYMNEGSATDYYRLRDFKILRF